MKITTLAAAVMAIGASSQVFSEPAGRVLALAGSATLERAGLQLPLQPGTLVESGDVLAVGDKSTLQVRFTDESVVALRPNSQFKIENYQFNKNADTDRSLLGLLKGGMRTVTGLIGKANQKNYAVQTATATIGIRGTHFSVVSCNNDCTRPDGSRELNGTFGAVTDGRITVSNASGAREFGQQDYFHVPAANMPPVQLLAPPAILSDRSAPATRPRSTAAATTESGGGAASAKSDSGSSANTSTSPQLVVQQAPVIALNAPLTRISSADQQGALAGGSSGSGALSGNNLIQSFELRARVNGVNDLTELNGRIYKVSELRNEVPELRNRFFVNAQTLANALRGIQPVGTSVAAGAHWVYDAPNAGDSTNRAGTHRIFGDVPKIALPTAGFAQYNHVGGTAPTDNFGRVGVFNAGALLMNFGEQRIRTLGPMTMNFGTSALHSTPTQYTIPGNTVFSMAAGPQTLVGTTCVGCISAPTGQINGGFVGVTAVGYAATINVSGLVAAGKLNAGGNVAAFARQ